MSGKFALIIANTEYIDPGLARLAAPGKDAEDFVRVLKDQNVCAFDDIKVLLNQPEYIVRRGIDVFFDQKKPDDLLVLYFSGHGVRDELGTLYLAVRNTIRSGLRSTAVKSDYIREAMDQSRSKRQVLILDCCNSGAFAQGTKGAPGGSIGTASAFEGTGYGRVVLTASDSTQFAWEGDKVIGKTQNSLFTHFLIKGLEGEADTDGDGKITVDELYDYAFERIVNVTPKQTPGKWSYRQQGEIILRQSTRIEDIKPIPLPSELINAIESTLPLVREGAVQHLEELLNGKNIGLSHSARQALIKIATKDDSNRVAMAARQALKSLRGVPQKTDVKKEINKRKVAEQKQWGQIGILLVFMVISVGALFLFLVVNPNLLQGIFLPKTTGGTPTQGESGVPSTYFTEPPQTNLTGINNIPTDTQIILTAETLLTQTSLPFELTFVPMITESPIVFTPTPTIALTTVSNCETAPKRLSIGITAEVVTAKQTLFLRKGPSWGESTVTAMRPNTKVQVFDGPACGLYRYVDNENRAHEVFLWWWKVQEPSGTTGWVVEGYDDIDVIYILPINPKDEATLIYIPPGNFTMGLSEEQVNILRKLCGAKDCENLYDASGPENPVKLTYGYWIYRTEVSNAQYAKCVSSGNCDPPQNYSTWSRTSYYDNPNFAQYPVVWMDWNKANTYCAWAGGRLLTSAEWEKAASWNEAKQEKYIFPWGNFFDGKLLNFCDQNCQDYHYEWADLNYNDSYAATAPVESYFNGVSPYGVLNMAGNVWEWVSDFYSSTYYSTNTNWTDPKGPDSSDSKNHRVGRGGSLWIRNAITSATIQDFEEPSNYAEVNYDGIGIRCAIDEP